MKFIKLTKPVNTVVKSYEKTPEGTFKTDENGNRIVATGPDGKALQRTVKIEGVEYPAFDSIAEAAQTAGSDEKLLAAINKLSRDDSIALARASGSGFGVEDKDEEIIAKAREKARGNNPFVDKRGTSENAVNALLAGQMKQAVELAEKVKSGEMSNDELVAFILAGKV